MPVTEDLKPTDGLGVCFKQKYRSMKNQLKTVLYENEYLKAELRKSQRELLDIYSDKETLLNKVIQYEDIDSSSSDSDSPTSDNEYDLELILKRKPIEKAQPTIKHDKVTPQKIFISSNPSQSNGRKKRKTPVPTTTTTTSATSSAITTPPVTKATSCPSIPPAKILFTEIDDCNSKTIINNVNSINLFNSTSAESTMPLLSGLLPLECRIEHR